MKKSKKYYTIILVTIISIISTVPIYAKESSVNNYLTIEIEGRARKDRKVWFKSYPPQYYEGASLTKVQKVSNGYFGFYR